MQAVCSWEALLSPAMVPDGVWQELRCECLEKGDEMEQRAKDVCLSGKGWRPVVIADSPQHRRVRPSNTGAPLNKGRCGIVVDWAKINTAASSRASGSADNCSGPRSSIQLSAGEPDNARSWASGGDVGCSLGRADRSARLVPLASGHTRSRPLPPKEIHSATVSEYPGPLPLPAIPSIPHEECGGFFFRGLGRVDEERQRPSSKGRPDIFPAILVWLSV